MKDNIWHAGLADMKLLSKLNKEIRFLLCVIDTFGKYAWAVPLKDNILILSSQYFNHFKKKTKQNMGR